jgi:hypothetical protein
LRTTAGTNGRQKSKTWGQENSATAHLLHHFESAWCVLAWRRCCTTHARHLQHHANCECNIFGHITATPASQVNAIGHITATPASQVNARDAIGHITATPASQVKRERFYNSNLPSQVQNTTFWGGSALLDAAADTRT